MRGAAATRDALPRPPEPASPDGRFRDGAVEQGTEASVQAQDAMAADRLPHAVPWRMGRSATPVAPNPPPPPPPPSSLQPAKAALRTQGPAVPSGCPPSPWRTAPTPRPRSPLLTNASVTRRVRALVQLQLCLHVLGGKGDANFDAARQAACGDQGPGP